MLYNNFVLWHEIWFDRNVIASDVLYTDLSDTCFHSFSDDFLVLCQNKKNAITGHVIWPRHICRQNIVTAFWYAMDSVRKVEWEGDCIVEHGFNIGIHFAEIDLVSYVHCNGVIANVTSYQSITNAHTHTHKQSHRFPEHVCVDVSECDAVRSYVIMYRKWCRKGTNKLDRTKNSTPLI